MNIDGYLKEIPHNSILEKIGFKETKNKWFIIFSLQPFISFQLDINKKDLAYEILIINEHFGQYERYNTDSYLDFWRYTIIKNINTIIQYLNEFGINVKANHEKYGNSSKELVNDNYLEEYKAKIFQELEEQEKINQDFYGVSKMVRKTVKKNIKNLQHRLYIFKNYDNIIEYFENIKKEL